MSANENGSTVCTSQPVRTQENTLNVAILSFPETCDKANLIARLTRAGHAVHVGSEHDFTVVNVRFGQSRYCPDLAALQNFARTVGVTR